MARVFSGRNKPRDNAENRIRQLAERLPDEWVVFCSRPISRGRYFGEADFVFINLQKGVVVVEAKDGDIDYDAAEGWLRRTRDGARPLCDPGQRGNDPFEQAKSFTSCCLKRLRDDLRLERKCPFASAVAFPDVGKPKTTWPAAHDQRLFLTAEAFMNAAALERALELALESARLPGPGAGGSSGAMAGAIRNAGLVGGGFPEAQALLEMFARPPGFTSAIPAEISRIWHHICELTEEQKKVVKGLMQNDVAMVSGCAGTGKTVLACFETCRLVKEGKKVLLLCFTPSLGCWLRTRRFPGSPGEVLSTDFMEFCYRMGVGPIPAGQKVEAAEALGQLASQWDEDKRFDVIIVDEAQDLWGPPLDALAKCARANEKVRLFFDDNQNLFSGSRMTPWDNRRQVARFDLTNVVRCTQPILSEYLSLYRTSPGSTPPTSKIEGKPVVRLSSDDMLEDICRRHLPNLQPQHTVAVLTAGANPLAARTEIAGRKIIAPDRLSCAPAPWVAVSTVAGFKGLEADVVILDEREQTLTEMERYVGRSRARAMLIIVQSPRQSGLAA